jgi:hypothetical protein
MSIISETFEGFLNFVFKNFNFKKRNSCWEKLNQVDVPSWVEKASHKFHKKYPVRNHDLRKDFVGNYYIYRIFYRKWAHGRVKEDFYRKRKR